MDRDTRHEVGERLLEIRGSRDQRTFAEAVDSVQQTISKYERGEIPRSWLFLARLAEEEGIDLNFLLTGERVGSDEPVSGGPAGGNGNGSSTTRPGARTREAKASYA